jgi:hypothetical protein
VLGQVPIQVSPEVEETPLVEPEGPKHSLASAHYS